MPFTSRRHAVPIASLLCLLAVGCAPSGVSDGRDGDISAVNVSARALAEVEALAADVRGLITPEGLETQAAAIIQHERPSGSAGEFAAIDHIVAELTAAGVPVEVHEHTAYASTPVSASLEVPGTGFAPEAITYSFSAPASGLEARVVDVGSLRDLPPLQAGTGERLELAGEIDAPGAAAAGFPGLEGAIALVTGNPGSASVDRLEMLGAVGVVYVNQEERLNDLIVTTTWGTPSLRNYQRLPKLPAVHIKASDGEALRAMMANGTVRARISAEVDVGWRTHRLAVATVQAGATGATARAGEAGATVPAGAGVQAGAGDRGEATVQAGAGDRGGVAFVLFGGHIDAWYHGGTDEGASNAAMVELAKAFHAHRGRLRRDLVVAWWPGHSNARYGGSTWYADHFFAELRRRGVAYVNVDGVGQIDSARFGASASQALAGLAAAVIDERTGNEVTPRQPGRNSDQSFNGAGVPLLQINHSRLAEDGGYWWWHTPDDTFDKIDFDVLKIDTDLYADALAALLAAPILPVDVVRQVGALDDALARWRTEADGRFDLSEPIEANVRLAALAARIRERIDDGTITEADLELVAITRPIHRVMYSPQSPFHPDSGLEGGALPGLMPIRTLANASPDGDAYRFAEVTLVRERNRLMAAIDEAIERAETVLAGSRTP